MRSRQVERRPQLVHLFGEVQVSPRYLHYKINKVMPPVRGRHLLAGVSPLAGERLWPAVLTPWEVIAALHAVRDEAPDLQGEDLASELVAATGVGREGIAAGLRYYAAYPGEIDERVEANRDASRREEQLWQAEQRLLRRSVA